jgi:hypothetical protein
MASRYKKALANIAKLPALSDIFTPVDNNAEPNVGLVQ